MTTTSEAVAGTLNGQAPGTAGQAGGGGEAARASAGETLMGLIGIAFAAGLLLIGLDLVTGGAVSRLFSGGERQAAGDNAGG